jgi:hypothetical protein
MDIAERYDVFDDSLRNRIRFMSEQMMRVQAADAAGKLNDPDFAATAGPIVDFYVGILVPLRAQRRLRLLADPVPVLFRPPV